MALINEENKFIFFHLFKCAGNSMRSVLNTNTNSCYEYAQGHSLPRDVRELMINDGNKNIYDSYFKFTVIRNPFDWLLSTYNYILAYPNHRNHEAVKSLNLGQFIQYYVDYMMLNEGRELGHNKCVTIYDYVSNEKGKIIVDFIGKFENIKEDSKYIFDKININHKELPFVNVNPSRESDYRVCYDKKTRKLVEKYFAKDLEYFNYKF